MATALTHRGPDDSGFLFDGPCGMGQRRLSIIDLASGHQPIGNEDGRYWIVFNGEIYNYRQIASELEGLGHRFATQSDTESILHGYEQWGPEVLDRLRGIFSFAIWDKRDRFLFLARDQFGVKPLYYTVNPRRLVFASELRGVMAHGDVDARINAQAVASLLTFGYVTGERRICEDVRVLLPGHWCEFRADGHTIGPRRYWDVRFEPEKVPLAEWERRLADGVADAVRTQLVSDVPVGAFLSGGIDSSLVVALASKDYPGRLRTYTIGFSGGAADYRDERPFAAAVARRYGTEHVEEVVAPPGPDEILRILSCVDEPLGDDSIIPSYYVSRLAARDVKVVLSGLGGDELFGGYERYLGFRLSQDYGRLPGWLRRRAIEPWVARLHEGHSERKWKGHLKRFCRSASQPPAERYLGFIRYLSRTELISVMSTDAYRAARMDDLEELCFRAQFQNAKAHTNMDRMFYQDFQTYLCDDILAVTDRLSMAHSLEARVPLLDPELVKLAARIPVDLKVTIMGKKRLLKRIAARHLPVEVLTHKKQGFVGPMASWIRGGLRELVSDTLASRAFSECGLIQAQGVSKLLDSHLSGESTQDRPIWSLFVLARWLQDFQESWRAAPSSSGVR